MEKSILGAIISDLASVNNHRRSFIKDLPMKDVKDRDAQFLNIADIREKAAGVKLPIISIDTKKKELIGNFKRDRKICPRYCP